MELKGYFQKLPNNKPILRRRLQAEARTKRVFLAAIMLNLIARDGKGNWFEGQMHQVHISALY